MGPRGNQTSDIRDIHATGYGRALDLGCPRRFGVAEVKGRHLVDDFITPQYKSSVQDVFSKALSGVETANFEFPLVTKAGKSVEILLNATTRRDERDLIIGVVGIGQDITARVAQEQEYSRLIDTANAPIFGVNVKRPY